VSTPPGGIPPTNDPKVLMRSRQYGVLLLLAVAGLIVSTGSWLFLEGVHELETAVLFGSAATLSVSTPAPLLVFKGLARSLSLTGFRDGSTFPTVFLGVAACLVSEALAAFVDVRIGDTPEPVAFPAAATP
jgi:hypothetical protein